jgi:hypothetical protein
VSGFQPIGSSHSLNPSNPDENHMKMIYPIKAVSLLVGTGKPTVNQTAQGVTVSVDVAEGRQPIDTVVKLELNQSALALAPINPLPVESNNSPRKRQ